MVQKTVSQFCVNCLALRCRLSFVPNIVSRRFTAGHDSLARWLVSHSLRPSPTAFQADQDDGISSRKGPSSPATAPPQINVALFPDLIVACSGAVIGDDLPAFPAVIRCRSAQAVAVHRQQPFVRRAVAVRFLRIAAIVQRDR